MLDRFELFTAKIAALYKGVQRIKSTEMTEFGLKGAHVMCLYTLSREGGLTAAELCKACDEDKAAISRTTAELFERGLIKSESEEGKKYKAKIFLTLSGEEVAAKITKLIEAAVFRCGQGLTDEQRANFYYALSLISDNMQALEGLQGENL